MIKYGKFTNKHVPNKHTEESVNFPVTQFVSDCATYFRVYCLSSLYTRIASPNIFQFSMVREIGSYLDRSRFAEFVFNSLI